MFFKTFHSTLLGLVLGWLFNCEAVTFLEHFSSQNATCSSDPRIELSIYSGCVNSKAQELVFAPKKNRDPLKTISRLDWKMNNVWVLGGSAQLNCLSNQLHFSIEGWSKCRKRPKSTMIDRDYLGSSSHFTCISSHPDTRLKSAYEFDLGIAWNFYRSCLRSYQIEFDVLAGYQSIEKKWESYGGEFFYHVGYKIYHGYINPRIKGISYEQRFQVPYFGCGLRFFLNDSYRMRVSLKYTPHASIKICDKHYLRSLIVKDSFNHCHYLIFGAECVRTVWRDLDCQLKYSYEHLNAQAADSFYFIRKKKPIKQKKAAGLKHFQQLISIGLTAKF